MASSFYPHGGPREYSYTSSFYNYREATGKKAKANTSYTGISIKTEGNKAQILSNLDALILGARTAELSFLADTGVNLVEGDNTQQIFKNFNLILNSQQLFERNLAMLKQLSEGVNNELIDPTKYFFMYLANAVQKYGKNLKIDARKVAGAQLEKIADKIIGDALEQTYNRFLEVIDKDGNIKSLQGGQRKGNREQYQAMTEMVETIRKLKGTGLFGKYASLFNIDKLLKESSDQSGNVIRKPRLSKRSFDQGGTPLELVTAVITTEMAKIHQTNSSGNTELIITGQQTGSGGFNQQKGDAMIAYAEGSVDFSDMEKIFKQHSKNTGSKRLQNIEALKEYLDKFGSSIKHLLIISDKNYTINAEWKGARAQEAMNLKDAEDMLANKFSVPQVSNLIDYLANCGADMIQGPANNEIRIGLASYIGYFLFDHLEITGTVGSTNVVNIINLNNIFIPLSVYLEGVYKSIEANLANMNYDNLVSVSISLGGDVPDGPWTKSLWEDYREIRKKSSSVEYHIMRDIASFITDLMS